MAYLPIRKPTTPAFSTIQNPFYNSKAWRNLSKEYRRVNPLCEECARKGIIKVAQLVDHRLPIRMGGEAMDWNNLQSLCHRCHNSKSGREGKETTEYKNFEVR